MQRKRKRKDGDDGEEYVLPGLEQEEFDYEGQVLAAVLAKDTPGKFTKVDPQSDCFCAGYAILLTSKLVRCSLPQLQSGRLPCLSMRCHPHIKLAVMQAVQLAGASGPHAQPPPSQLQRPQRTSGDSASPYSTIYTICAYTAAEAVPALFVKACPRHPVLLQANLCSPG